MTPADAARLGRAGPVYALSARPGVGGLRGFRRFRQDLECSLREERTAAVTDSARRSASRALGSLRLALDLGRQAATLPAEEVAGRRARFAAAGLGALDERGGGLLAEAEDRRDQRAAELDRAAGLLRSAAARLQPSPRTPQTSQPGTPQPARHPPTSTVRRHAQARLA
jgi:hypothetical protein